MGRIAVHAFVTLDGFAQSPGGEDEDREGDFLPYGGWMMKYDEEMDRLNEGGEVVAGWESKTDALLLGRKTYAIWCGAWAVWDENAPGFMGENTRRYNRVPKYVASRILTELPWKNSHLLGPDVPAAVKKLKAGVSGEIRVWGSTGLMKTLMEHDLIDEYRLAVYPQALRTGKTLFAGGSPFARFTRVESRALQSGVLVNTYRRADAARDPLPR